MAEEFHRGVIDLLDDGLKFVVGELLENGFPGQVAAYPAVPVLVAAPAA